MVADDPAVSERRALPCADRQTAILTCRAARLCNAQNNERPFEKHAAALEDFFWE
jgi:hypothetical protein